MCVCVLLANIKNLNHGDFSVNMIKLSSYQGGEDGLSIEADERGCSCRFAALLFTFVQTGETVLHKLVVVLHRAASGYGR